MTAEGQTPDEAIELRDKFILKTLNEAKNTKDRNTALKLLAQAIHPIMDKYSPVHRDKNGKPKVWNPWSPWGHSPSEFIGKERLRNITKAIRDKINIEIREACNYVFY